MAKEAAHPDPEPVFQVVWPLGRSASGPDIKPSSPVTDLCGKTVAELWDYAFKGDQMFPIIRQKLRQRFSGIQFVEYPTFGHTHGPREREVVAGLPVLLRQHRVDAVISGVGASGSSTPAVVRASIEAEKMGIRSTSIVTRAFAPQARAIASSLGFSNLALAEYPGVTMIDSEEDLRRKVAEVVVDQIVEGFAGTLETTGTVPEPGPRDIVFSGTLDEVQEHFDQKQWSDGLPVIPPTIRRVEEFLRYTDHPPEKVIGTLLPEKREATVWNVAVNAVMAGCRPEYMPVLLAIVEVISDPIWRIEDAGSTPGWNPLVIVSGPIIKELNFNFGSGVMRAGRRANTSIGRFLRLYMRNIPGLRIAASNDAKVTYTDGGTIAGMFHVALAENEDAVAELGWKTFGEERGFAAGKNVVTVQSVVATSPPIYVAGEGAGRLAKTIADVWGSGDVAYWSCTGLRFGRWDPLLVMTPAVALGLARGGWTKDDLRRYLAEKVKVSAALMDEYFWETAGSRLDFRQMVEEGAIPPEYAASDDPNRLLPVFPWPETIGIVVAGDAGRNQVKGYTSNHQQGPPVSREVKLPARWRALLAQQHRDW